MCKACVHVCVCVCKYVYTCMCMHVEVKGQLWVSFLFLRNTPPFYYYDGISHWDLTPDRLDWLGIGWQGPAHLHLPSTGLQVCTATPKLLCWHSGSNSGAHACVASTLDRAVSPASLRLHFLIQSFCFIKCL